MHDRHLKSRAVLCHAVHHLLVAPTLKPPLQLDPVPHVQAAAALGQRAPGDTGQVIGPAIFSVDRQHQVADLPAQRGAPQDRRLAQHAGELQAVRGLRAGGGEAPREEGDDQAAAGSGAVVEGADLAPGPPRGRLGPGDSPSAADGRHYVEAVLGPGEAGDREGKNVVAHAVILMGEDRLSRHCAAE